MFKELVQKSIMVKNTGFLQHYRKAFADNTGLVSIGQIAAECIAIMVLICVICIVPLVASSVQDNLPEVKDTSAWANYTDAGADLWGTALPLIDVACIIVIIGLVLHVVWSLKTANRD